MRAVLTIIVFTVFLFSACKQDPQQVLVEIPALRLSQICDASDVYQYRQKYTDSYREMAESYFRKGERLEKDNIKAAIWNIRRSITLWPEYESYIKLGELLMADRQYQEAELLYGFIAEPQYFKEGMGSSHYLFIKPDEHILTEYFVSSTLANHYLPFEIVYTAEAAGMKLQDMKSRWLSDKRLQFDTGSMEYKNFLLCFLTEQETKAYADNPENFNNFLNRIPHQVNFSVTQEQLASFDYNQFNGMHWSEGPNLMYVEMNFLKEKKENPDRLVEYNTLHQCRINDSLVLLHYSIDTSAKACPLVMRHIYHVLAIYNNSAQLLDYKVVAAQAGNYQSTMTFNEGLLSVTTYQRKWSKLYQKHDFDNELLEVKPEQTLNFKIDEQGKFILAQPVL